MLHAVARGQILNTRPPQKSSALYAMGIGSPQRSALYAINSHLKCHRGDHRKFADIDLDAASFAYDSVTDTLYTIGMGLRHRHDQVFSLNRFTSKWIPFPRRVRHQILRCADCR